MLDLGFVRTNLELVEEKLRARGEDPAALLGDFRALDQSRREAITTAERLKARRNELSQQVGTLKKAGQDASAVMDETRALKEKLDELDQIAVSLDEQLRQSLARIPNLTHDEVPIGKSEADNLTVKTWGEIPKFDLGTGRGARHSRPGTRSQAEWRAVRGLHGRWSTARTGVDQLHA
jgi:seryl-tRNA synthetase